MSNGQSLTYAILLLNGKLYIENKKENKMLSISKDTHIIHQENPNFKKLKVMDKTIETQGILGIIQLIHAYYLLYITQSKAICLVNGFQISQIAQVGFLSLSTLPQSKEDKKAIISFQEMIGKGLFYYSLSYDLTNLYQCQLGYLDYKTTKTDYLWNNNLMAFFNSSHIKVESFFVFCICGYVKAVTSSLEGKPLVNVFISRKKRFNFKSNHTQIEAIIAYNDKSIFNYVMYSFGYSSDIVQGEEICLSSFKKHYAHYNQPKHKSSTVLINLLDNNPYSDAINRVIFKTFDKAKSFQFSCVKEFSKEINGFVEGILSVIHAFEYNLMNKRGKEETEDEGEVSLVQKTRIQKGFFVIVSNDGSVSPIELERCLIWEVIELFLGNFKDEDNNKMLFSFSKAEKEAMKDGGLHHRNSFRMKIKEKLGMFHHQSTFPSVNKTQFESFNRKSFKAKYDEMFDEYLKQALGIDQFNDYTAMDYFVIDQQLKPISKFPQSISDIKEEKLTVYISTWNVGAVPISDKQDISPLLHPLNYCGFFNKSPVDLYLIGLQEIVKLNPHKVLFASNEVAVSHWIDTIAKEIPNHELVTSMSLVGVLFLVFARKSIKPDIKDIQTQTVKTGFFGKLGNKGSCSLRFTYHKKSFAFATGHLAAGSGSNDHRLNELNNIAFSVFDKERRFADSDYWFIFGDMNFRVDLDAQSALMYIDAGYLDFLKANDQLLQNKKKIEVDYEEEDITFAPSYKFEPKTAAYNAKRTSSWCDRIIYKPTKHIKALAYDKIELLCSDHMPVIGVFQLFIPSN